MNKTSQLLVPTLLAIAGGAFAADDGALLRCRAIVDGGARLACYDALVPTPERAAQQFGLEQKLADKAVSAAPQAIDSHIPGRFEGWTPNARIRLANGQVWQVSDGSSGVYSLVDPKVRIRRGTMGSFFLEIEGENRSPRVRRVQ